MDSKLWSQAEAIFLEACELPPEQWTPLLNERCANDQPLRDLVDRMLENQRSGLPGFLESHPPLADALDLPEGTRVGQFTLKRVIGRGGMGTVYLAKQVEPSRQVALKVLHPGLVDRSLADRFRQEIQILGQLNHRGIVQIFEAGTTKQGQAFFAMEYAPGRPLGEFVQQENLTSQEKLDLIMGICQAVQHAHNHGIIHRDLKPSNIMAIRSEDGTIETRVLDFGVAQASNLQGQLTTLHTVAGQLMGTLAYMSPEQLAGGKETLDARSDIYQLGVIIYELLSGQLPIDVSSSGFVEAMRRISEVEPTGLGSLDKDFRGDIETIINKALAKNRQHRYSSATDLADDIKRHLQGKPIQARPTSAITQIFSRARQKSSRIAIMALIAMTMIMFYWSWQRVSSQPKVQAPLKLTRLTHRPEVRPYSPQISPDGTKIAYTDPELGALALLDIETGEVERLFSGTDQTNGFFGVDWHPTENWLALVYQTGEHMNDLVRYNLVDGTRQLIRQWPGATSVQFHPDGKSVTLIGDQNRALYRLDLASGDLQELQRVQESELIVDPVWSPNGKRLAYIRFGKPGRTLECVDLNGHHSILLNVTTEEEIGIYRTPIWVADDQLLFSTPSYGEKDNFVLKTLKLDPNSNEALGPPEFVYAFPNMKITGMTYAASARRLTFIVDKAQGNTWLLDLKAGSTEEAKVVKGRGWPATPIGFSPDSESLCLWERRATPLRHVFLQNLRSNDVELLDCFPGKTQPMELSIDGTRLITGQYPNRLQTIPLNCGPLVDLQMTIDETENGAILTSSADSNGTRYLLSQSDKFLFIRKFNLEQRLLSDPVRYPLVFPDSLDFGYVHFDGHPSRRMVTYCNFDNRIHLLELDSLTETTIDMGNDHFTWLRWTPDGQHLICGAFRYKQKNRWIKRIGLVTGQQEVLWSSSILPEDPIISPDGTKLAFYGNDTGVDFYMLEGF